MGRGDGSDYMHNQRNWTYLSPNKTFIISICSVNISMQVTTVRSSASPANLIQTKPSSIPKLTNKL